MNKLLIIGNGFDLAHNLPTRYSDFIIWYINDIYRKYKEIGVYEDEFIKIGDRPNRRKAIMLNYNNIFLHDFLSFTEGNTGNGLVKFKNRFIHDLLKDIGSKEQWVDIEYYYYLKLTNIYKISENRPNHNVVEGLIQSLNIGFELIKKKLIEYLNTIEINKSIVNEEIENRINQEILWGLSGTNNVLTLNFNYTSTTDYYEALYPNKGMYKIVHIHGKLIDKQNPIIFGYGDEIDPYYEKIENLKNNKFLNHIKSFYYFKTDNYRILYNFLQLPSYQVYILGHSCGITDRVLLSNIFDNRKCKEIKIFYYKKSETENDYFEKTQEISRHFSKSSKGNMRHIIVPFSRSNPLVDI